MGRVDELPVPLVTGPADHDFEGLEVGHSVIRSGSSWRRRSSCFRPCR
jgi:hypothetical protein